MSDNLEMPKTFAELEAYTSRILASQQAAHDAEIAKLKEEIEKERIICTEYIEQRNEAIAACAMKDEALRTCITVDDWVNGNDVQLFNKPMVDATISASPQQVSDWERKQLEPLRAQVAMLRARVSTYVDHDESCAVFRTLTAKCTCGLVDELANTQAAAEQFIAECSAKAIMDYEAKRDTYTHTCQRCAVSYAVADGENEDCPHCGCTDEEAKAIINELRATSKKAG